jgi:NDP-sugar pyrophosphorylase family protein
MTRVIRSLARPSGLKHDHRSMSERQSVRHAVILAAGRGTRMKALTEETPKPMLPIAGRPLLEHVLRALRKAGVAHFVIVTGYRAEQVETHFRDGSGFGVEVEYRRQEARDGTARALLLARDAIGRHDFLLALGDILIDPANYPTLLDTFVRRRADGLIGVNWVEDPYRGAAVYADGDQRIERIVEKPPAGTSSTHWNNAGIALFRPVVFDYAAKIERSPRGEYELPDAITGMLGDGLALYAFPLQGFWSDVGTPEDLERAARALSGSG